MHYRIYFISVLILGAMSFRLLDNATKYFLNLHNEKELLKPYYPSRFQGKPIPSFSLMLAKDRSILKSSDINIDRGTILFYFDPYCPVCRRQLNEFVNYAKELSDFKFIFITPYPFYQMMKIYDEFNLANYGNIVVGRDFDDKVSTIFNIGSVPASMLYSSNGKMKGMYIGFVGHKQIISDLK